MRFITRSYLIEQFQNFVDNVLCRYGKVRELTHAEYSSLPAEKATDGIVYFISDTGTIIKNGITYNPEPGSGENKIVEILGSVDGKTVTFTSDIVFGSNDNFGLKIYASESRYIKQKVEDGNTLTVTYDKEFSENAKVVMIARRLTA